MKDAATPQAERPGVGGTASVASTPSPRPPASPSAVGTPNPRTHLRASIQNGLLTLLNDASFAVSDLRLTLVGVDGRRFEARAGGTLGPGEEVLVSLADFTPEPPANLAMVRIEAAFVDETHKARRAMIALAAEGR